MTNATCATCNEVIDPFKEHDCPKATYYEVEQGMPDPRTGTLSWRPWEYYPGTLEGKRRALKDAKKLSFARVITCRRIWQSPRITEDATA